MKHNIEYFGYEEVLNVYSLMVKASGGGCEGVREEGGIKAALDFVQNDDYYPTFANKLSYIVYSFCAGHFFDDGNKRIALTLGAYFLHKNGYNCHALIFMRAFEAIVYHVAASHINQELLQRIILSFLTSPDYDEELKIEIAKAMNNGTLGFTESI